MESVIRVPFPTSRLSHVALDALRVDPEPRRSGVVRELKVEEAETEGGPSVLVCRFTAKDPRFLRVSVNSFLDLLALVIDTMHQFDQ